MKNPSFNRADFYSIIKSRRSVRVYKKDPVPEKLIKKLIEAATWAPSGKNLQNWRFFILTGKKKEDYLKLSQKSWLSIKDALVKKLKPSLYEFTERFFYTLGEAPVLIFAYSKPNPEEQHQTSLGSVYMSVQNLLLAANYEGLGTCVMGAPLEIKDEVNEFLQVKEMDLICGITLGYPNHEPPAAERRKDHVKFF
ncbi:MAG TPA: nitroreductase family protein [Nitrospinota bacterium]|jgi:hypothetical protein|nr:nitroreductase family protein [Nitrospinota bacterium]